MHRRRKAPPALGPALYQRDDKAAEPKQPLWPRRFRFPCTHPKALKILFVKNPLVTYGRTPLARKVWLGGTQDLQNCTALGCL